MKISFENIEQKLESVSNSKEYEILCNKVNNAKKIYLLGNGGLHFVASHMSTDLSRLIPGKSVYSFDSVGFITSNANDHGFEQLFVRWLETIAVIENPTDCLVIGMSCSGNSVNVINALNWAKNNKIDTYMLSGQHSEILEDDIDELSYNCEYFHTVEVMTMMLFYDIIHQTENKCPSIKGEKNRLKNSPLRSLNDS